MGYLRMRGNGWKEEIGTGLRVGFSRGGILVRMHSVKGFLLKAGFGLPVCGIADCRQPCFAGACLRKAGLPI